MTDALAVGTGRRSEHLPGAKRGNDYFFDMGRFLANDGISKDYRSLVRMFNTNFMLTKSPLLWGMTHSHGSFRVEAIGKTGAYIYVNDYPAPCKEFCYSLAGYMYAVGEMAKAKMVRVEEMECVTEGAHRCSFIGKRK